MGAEKTFFAHLKFFNTKYLVEWNEHTTFAADLRNKSINHLKTIYNYEGRTTYKRLGQ